MKNTLKLNTALQSWMDFSARRSIEEFMLFTHRNNLTLSQMSMLMKLFYGGPTTLLEMRQSLFGSRAAATQMVNKLVQRGLLERSEAPDDRRVKQICLTELGTTLVREGIAFRQQWLDHLVEGLDIQEQKLCTEAVSILNAQALKITSVSSNKPDK